MERGCIFETQGGGTFVTHGIVVGRGALLGAACVSSHRAARMKKVMDVEQQQRVSDVEQRRCWSDIRVS